MHIIIPVKSLKNAKLRLASVLSSRQRAEFSRLMLEDMLETLLATADVDGVTLVSNDATVKLLADQYRVDLFLTTRDGGYSEDATQALTGIASAYKGTLGILPADLPQLASADLSRLKQRHESGLTLCPALMDGGTNGLLFSPPLPVPLAFGINSLSRYRQAAMDAGVPVNIVRISSLERDIDRTADLLWLKGLGSGARAWSYLRDVEIVAT